MEEADVRTVHYVTQDAMSNLKLRVTLTRLSAARPRRTNNVLPLAGSADAAAASAAAGAAGRPTSSHDGSATAGAAPSGRPQPYQVVRTFAWQEKVYSKAELVAAQTAMRMTGQQQQQPGSSAAGSSAHPRTAHFGSQSTVGADRLQAAPPEGSVLFSYVQTDEWCERYETSRSITTSASEGSNHLARKLATDARNRQKMLTFQSMFLMADLGDETTVAGSNEKVLCVIRAYHDGSFGMRPGLSPGPAQRQYHFEDDHGAIYEFRLELASQSSAPTLEKRAARLASAVSSQAAELRRQAAADRLPLPGPDAGALRLLLLAELVSAAGFERDRLYLEWQLHYDPALWALQHSEQEVPQPGLIQGVSHVSRMVCYPPDAATDSPALWVAHFAHPIEVEWVAAGLPDAKHWPRLFLQVCTHDLWDRMTTEGYGWLQLGPPGGGASGSATHYVDTWKPLGSRRDQQRAFFIGGSEELGQMSAAGVPPGHSSRVLNKYGYKTQTSGNIKVRTHMVLQAGGADGGGAASYNRPAAANKAGAAAAAARQRRSLSLAIVLERARSRLQEARGRELSVREGLLVQAPTITAHPADMMVNEGASVQLSVKAVGMLPLRYQWFRDGRRLTVATSNSPLLVLVGVAAADSGSYHCQVANKDGSTASSKALLTVQRVGVLRAAGLAGAGSTAGSPAPPEASTSGASTSPVLAALATVSRTLPLGGSDRTGLPLSTRFGGGADSTPGGSGSGGVGARRSLSPLIGSRPVSAAGRFPPAGDAAGGGGGSSSGRLSGITVPARRFAASRPATAAAPQQQPAEPGDAVVASTPAVADGWFVGAADDDAGVSSALPPGERGGVPLQQQQQEQAAVDAEAAAGSSSPLRRARVSEQL